MKLTEYVLGKFYDLVLTILTPFIKFTGKIHSPFSHKKITGKQYYLWRDQIKIGTVLLTKINGEFSNLINPAKLKHAGIYVGDVYKTGICYVAEATSKGVLLTDLVTFLTTKDIVVVCRPKFIRDVNAFNKLLQDAALSFKGYPYDFMFEKGEKAFYCFELVAICFKSVYYEIQLNCKEIIKGKKIYDENTFLDDRFFETIIDSRE